MSIPINDPSLLPPFIGLRVKAVLRMTPLTLLANVINAAVIVHEFWSPQAAALLLAWGAAVLLGASMGLHQWWRLRQDPDAPIGRSSRTLSRSVRNGALLAAVWSAPMLLMFPHATASQQTLLALITCGMICAGGFALSTLPHAAISYVTILTLAGAAGLLMDPQGRYRIVILLLAGYSAIVVAAVLVASRNFGARLLSEAQTARQNDTLGLLLRDFEGQASDWLWEADADGRLFDPSERLANLFGLPEERLRDQPFATLIAATHPRLADDDRAAIDRLAAAFGQDQAFSDLLVPVTANGSRHWWKLSARPLPGDSGMRHWRGVGSDVTQVQQARQELDNLANFDSLTGLANRHRFHVRMATLLGPPGRTATHPPTPCALLLLDLNHFSTVNDTFGHAAGDRLLRVVARRLEQCAREGDLLARLGGDEFAVIIENCTSRAAAAHLAERLQRALIDPCSIQGAQVAVGVSIGIAMAPSDTDDPEQLLSYADMALYAVKAAGRRGYRFFDPTLGEQAHKRVGLEGKLRGALARRELSLHYQPYLDIGSGRVQGFEALLRWHSPEHGTVSPAEFIPIAEQSGLIMEIGRWVIYDACREAMSWPDALRVSVNVSVVQFSSVQLVDIVRDALTQAGLAPQRLELEITESVFLQDPERARGMLERLRGLGVQIALDDFGTGYASLSYLRQIPLDRLKIDRSFVAALGHNESPQRRVSQAIVDSIIELSAALDLAVTVEGVETREQADAFRRDRGLSGQGYLWARPMAADAVPGFLAQRPAGPQDDDSPLPARGEQPVLPAAL
ncbi:MAG TPA: EAL domain-containing protein [Burkholderiaceae bacterium]|nr:EAL domain-containing protein [Burkholderiaceae bacterium]